MLMKDKLELPQQDIQKSLKLLERIILDLYFPFFAPVDDSDFRSEAPDQLLLQG